MAAELKQEQSLLEKAPRVLPGGTFGHTAADLIIAEGKGSRVWDENGKEYIDYLLGSGPMIIGHGHPEVTAAVHAQLARGINERHTQRVAALIEDARERGGKVVFGGAVDVAAHVVSPTVMEDVPAAARIMHEEIFGPALPIIVYDRVEEVIDRINAAPKPLAMYIWTKDQRAADHLIENTSAGGTCINHVAAQFLHHNLPFGGVNNSGVGSYHSEWGIRAFSHERAIVRTRVMLAKMFFPPYTARVRKILDLVIRYL